MDREEQEEEVISPISPLELSNCIKMAKKNTWPPVFDNFDNYQS